MSDRPERIWLELIDVGLYAIRHKCTLGSEPMPGVEYIRLDAVVAKLKALKTAGFRLLKQANLVDAVGRDWDAVFNNIQDRVSLEKLLEALVDLIGELEGS